MNARFGTYHVLNWQKAELGGMSDALLATVQAVAKCNCRASPYLVANELIAGSIGRYLRLPVPPCCVADHDGIAYFMSLNFNLTGEALPPIIPSRFVADFPDLSAGVVAFDALIANQDRHDKNIAAVTQDRDRKRACVFDHDRCLFGAQEGRGVELLQRVRRELVIDGALNRNRRPHCLLSALKDDTGLHEWVSRIEGIPPWFIVETVVEAQFHARLTDAEKDAAITYLKDRQPVVRQLLRDGIENGAFPALENRGLL